MGQAENSHCSGLLGRTSLRQWVQHVTANQDMGELFRPSRPDFIETIDSCRKCCNLFGHCSGLLGRTSLRHECQHGWHGRNLLFRPSRPDFIETDMMLAIILAARQLFRPSRPDFIETSRGSGSTIRPGTPLFRPSRPDFIETRTGPLTLVFFRLDCSGLLGRTSLRPTPARRFVY